MVTMAEQYTMKEMLEKQYMEIQRLHETLSEVKTQTTLTNGRVTVVEKTVVDHTRKIDKLKTSVAYGTAILSIAFVITQNLETVKSLLGVV